jgi:uncharacterized DUF497 family protein
MDITFDPKKPEWTLAERGLDFAEAEEVFAGERPIASTIGTTMARSE